MPGTLFVPENCKTLKEAVERVEKDSRLTTIVVGKREHKVESTYLKVPSSMNIIGKPDVSKTEIVIVGGIWIEEEIPGNVHLQHMTIRQEKGDGLRGSLSFTMEDVIVEQCDYGVCVRMVLVV